LCYKFILKILAHHVTFDVQEWTTLFKLIGNMPLEFFSAKTLFDDVEARKSTATILSVLDK
jgi:hypothetical protein